MLCASVTAAFSSSGMCNSQNTVSRHQKTANDYVLKQNNIIDLTRFDPEITFIFLDCLYTMSLVTDQPFWRTGQVELCAGVFRMATMFEVSYVQELAARLYIRYLAIDLWQPGKERYLLDILLSMWWIYQVPRNMDNFLRWRIQEKIMHGRVRDQVLQPGFEEARQALSELDHILEFVQDSLHYSVDSEPHGMYNGYKITW